MNAFRTTLWFVTALAAADLASAASSTNTVPPDLSRPIRIINGQRVDLTPLRDWYKAKQTGQRVADFERPLSAWKLLRIERVVETGPANWKVEGQVDGTGDSIVLRNPPRREIEELNQLKARHDFLMVRTNQLQLDLPRVTAARKQAESEERAVIRQPRKWGPAAAAAHRSDALAHDEALMRRDLDAAKAELQRIEATGIDFKRPLTLEIMALKTGEMQDGKPVYDRGRVL